MAVYWSLFSLPLIWGLLPEAKANLRRFGVGLLAAFFVLIIGLRDGVGCDWAAYTEHYFMIGRQTLEQAIIAFDPFHVLLNRASWTLGLDLYGVDFFYAVIFAAGLFKFIDRQPIPWLALACAVPYMVSVVAMGYLRQAGALGMLMLAFLAYADRQVKKFILFVFLAAAMHKTALVFLPFSLLVNGVRLNVSGVAAIALTVGIGGAALVSATETYSYNYVGSKVMQSDGGLVRSLMNALAAVVFFGLRKSFKRLYRDYDFLRYMAALALLSVPLVSVASTAMDRVGLYLLPFQIAVVSRLPDVCGNSPLRFPTSLAIVLTYAMQFFVWLNFSPMARLCWVPYRSILF